MLCHLFRALGCLLHLWWSQDRIRIAPTDGRLLRLAPGSVLCLGDLLLEVTARTVQGTTIVYRCRSAHVEHEIHVGPGGEAILITGDVVRSVEAEELGVYERTSAW